TEDLLDSLGGRTLAAQQRARIVEAAEGNPLYLEQLLALASETGLGGERPLPPTLQALLVARLDRLGPAELCLLPPPPLLRPPPARTFSRCPRPACSRRRTAISRPWRRAASSWSRTRERCASTTCCCRRPSTA